MYYDPHIRGNMVNKKKKAVKKPTPMELQLQELLKKLEALESTMVKKPIVIPPTIVIEDLNTKTYDQLLMLLATEVITAWAKITTKGQNSRQLNVFNKLNSVNCQELLKELLERKSNG